MTQPLGESAFWILTALGPGRLHGYGIVQAVAAATSDAMQVKATTLYAVLERLEADGLVEQAGDELVRGRTRRYFRLTEAGAHRLRVDTDALEARLTAARASLVQFKPVGGHA